MNYLLRIKQFWNIGRSISGRYCVDTFSERAPLPRAYFDAVVFNDSLEHFPYPEPPLALARELLAESGALVCSVPNVRYIDNLLHLLMDKDWQYRESGILDRTHLRFFTKRSLIRTLGEAGFEVRRIEGINRRAVGLEAQHAAFPDRSLARGYGLPKIRRRCDTQRTLTLPLQVRPPVATSNSPTCGRVKLLHPRRRDEATLLG